MKANGLVNKLNTANFHWLGQKLTLSLLLLKFVGYCVYSYSVLTGNINLGYQLTYRVAVYGN